MLELARKQDTVRVVSDQLGNPTAASDIADGVLAVARHLIDGRGEERYGIFHMAAAGNATWADVAQAVFAASAARGGPTAHVVPIASAEYQTPARRPATRSSTAKDRACTALRCRPAAVARPMRRPDLEQGA